ncbi:MAG: hypothetical protein ACOC9Q_02200, partial [bacterium]
MIRSLAHALNRNSRTRDVILVLTATVITWELSVVIFQPPNIFLPPPSAIFVEFISTPEIFVRHM